MSGKLITTPGPIRISIEEMGMVTEPVKQQTLYQGRHHHHNHHHNHNHHRDGNQSPGGPGDPNHLNSNQVVYKCPSFPRLLPAPAVTSRADCGESIYTYSTTHLTDTPTHHHQRGAGGLSPDRGGRLVRCSSAFLPPLDSTPNASTQLTARPQTRATTQHHLLEAPPLVARSTSCPSIHPPGASMGRRGDHHYHHHNRSNSREMDLTEVDDDADVNLEGEVITDLPLAVSPGDTFPEFLPEVGSVEQAMANAAVAAAKFEEYPMHTRRIRERGVSTIDKCVGSHNGDVKDRSREKKKSSSAVTRGYVNIGDIPTAIAQRVMSEHQIYAVEAKDKVRNKCMEWLNTLDD